MNAPARLTPPVDTFHRAARTLPASFDENDNSFEICWTTGAAVTRFDWYDGEYYDETLSLAPGAVRLGRLNDGGPVLDSHREGGIASLLGSIVPGSARIEGGQGLARVRLADGPDMAGVVAKVRGGHLRKISVGYMVHVYERIAHDDGRAEMRAVDWEPVEISLVAVPADPGAQIRSKESKMTIPSHIRSSQHELSPQDRQPPAEGEAVTSAFIRRQCRALGFSDKQTLNLIDAYSDEPATRADFLEDMVAMIAAQQRGAPGFSGTPIDSSIRGEADYSRQSPVERLITRMSGALYARFANKAPVEESREFMGASVIDMARGLLIARGERAQWLSGPEIYQRYGAQTTSDFTQLLGAAMNAYLTEQYAAAPAPLLQLARRREVPDFREIKALALHGVPELLLVEENAEYQHAAYGESSESYRVHTFGRITSLSRQLIINDNLGAFVQIGGSFARAAGMKRADILAAFLVGNTLLSDGKGIFHADHGNLAVSGGPIDTTTLSAARQAIRAQKDRDGVTLIDVTPKYLVVGPAKETEAEKALAELNATTADDVNPFSGKLTLIVDVRLPGNAWYVFADPAAAPILEYSTLIGQGDSVFTDTRIGFNVDGVETKGRIDFGCGVIDFRGAYKNPGN